MAKVDSIAELKLSLPIEILEMYNKEREAAITVAHTRLLFKGMLDKVAQERVAHKEKTTVENRKPDETTSNMVELDPEGLWKRALVSVVSDKKTMAKIKKEIANDQKSGYEVDYSKALLEGGVQAISDPSEALN